MGVYIPTLQLLLIVNKAFSLKQVRYAYLQVVKQRRKKGLVTVKQILAGGETTVTLNQNPGLGGRNQEMSLAFALAAQQKGLTGNWVFLSGGSDGRDGPTDAAGGIVTPTTLERIAKAENYLHNHDAYHALQLEF